MSNLQTIVHPFESMKSVDVFRRRLTPLRAVLSTPMKNKHAGESVGMFFALAMSHTRSTRMPRYLACSARDSVLNPSHMCHFILCCSRWACRWIERIRLVAQTRRAVRLQSAWRGFNASRRFRVMKLRLLREEKVISGASSGRNSYPFTCCSSLLVAAPTQSYAREYGQMDIAGASACASCGMKNVDSANCTWCHGNAPDFRDVDRVGYTAATSSHDKSIFACLCYLDKPYGIQTFAGCMPNGAQKAGYTRATVTSTTMRQHR